MGYIRNTDGERTGYQMSAPLDPRTDVGCDFVMAYGLNATTAERIEAFRAAGYKVQLMTGIAWGDYVDYLNGKWDGREHWDEGQTDRYGNMIMHGKNNPYMVPTVAFADFMTERLKAAVDAGVEAIHVEEPEFWDRAGYSEAFKREYLLYYRREWTAPHESLDACYKAAALKAYLYSRTIDRVGSAIKEYALSKYGRAVRFYVPTHSLLNYTQWKIISPEGKLADLTPVDGCIAQVWTGTSRERNWFNGTFRERTFETAYLEYGVMQELVKGTGRKMWFLHDPIEDNPAYDWEDYRKNYLKTVTASLLHGRVNRFEICPWPNRVFHGKYPKDSPLAESIPPEYATLLNNIFQTLGDIECAEQLPGRRVGIIMGDSQLYQRNYPDSELGSVEEKTGTVIWESEDELEEFKKLFNGCGDRQLMNKFVSSAAFPQFYALALPLLKYGLAVRPVLLDNIRRYNGYLDDYDVLMVSYEFVKPGFPDVNNALADWVRRGGRLIYIGDGSDPYHKIEGWWSGKYQNAAEHLFSALGIDEPGKKDMYNVGDGRLLLWKINPAVFCFSKENADSLRDFVGKAVDWEYTNLLVLRREPYVVAAALDESVSEEPAVLSGLFADMYTPDFRVVENVTLSPGENVLLFDLKTLCENEARVVGTSVRIIELTESGSGFTLCVKGAAELRAYIRLKIPGRVRAAYLDGEEISHSYDDRSETVLLSFDSDGKRHVLTVSAEGCKDTDE